MEKFSNQVFDDKKSSSVNNDNIISINDLLYNIEEVFPSVDYYLLSNIIILESVKKYHKDYGSFSVPFSYISFYFSEFSKYVMFQTFYLKKFLLIFQNKNNNLEDSIIVFSKSFIHDTQILTKFKSEFESKTNTKSLKITKELISKSIACDSSEENISSAVICAKAICDKIENTSEDHNLKYLYIDYLSTYSNKRISTKPQLKTIIQPPKQEKEQKVSKLVLPTIPIGKVYPKSFTKSRIDSAFFAWGFLGCDQSYKLITNYKFVKAVCTDGFIEKRQKLFEDKSSKFDLF